MNTFENIMSRRSVRGFLSDKQISDVQLKKIFDAAMYAPLALNTVLWHFTALQNKQMLDKIVSGVIGDLKINPTEHIKMRLAMPNFSPFYGAPTVIVVSGDNNNPWSGINCGAAIQNILLAANDLGIDSCLVGMANKFLNSEKAAEIRQEIGIPEDYSVIGCAALGFRRDAEVKTPNKHFDEIDKIINVY